MLNDIIFSNSFVFRTFEFAKDRKNDNRRGVSYHYFAYMIKGSCKLCSDDGTVEVSEGDAFYIPNGKRYISLWYGEPNIKFISLGFGYMPNFRAQSYNTQTLYCDERERELFFRIADHEAVDEHAVGEFYTLAASLIEKLIPEKKSCKSELISRAEAIISENPRIGVSELSRVLAVSESALYAAFQKHSESSICDVKRRITMERARELLISTDISIEELAEKLGISSSSYLRKLFHAHFGKSPREIRKTYSI